MSELALLCPNARDREMGMNGAETCHLKCLVTSFLIVHPGGKNFLPSLSLNPEACRHGMLSLCPLGWPPELDDEAAPCEELDAGV